MPHVYEIDVRIPMRDGVALAANVWRLAEGKGPTLLVRLPYGKDVMGVGLDILPNMLTLLEAGYALVVQDCRGRGKSVGW